MKQFIENPSISTHLSRVEEVVNPSYYLNFKKRWEKNNPDGPYDDLNGELRFLEDDYMSNVYIVLRQLKGQLEEFKHQQFALMKDFPEFKPITTFEYCGQRFRHLLEFVVKTGVMNYVERRIERTFQNFERDLRKSLNIDIKFTEPTMDRKLIIENGFSFLNPEINTSSLSRIEFRILVDTIDHLFELKRPIDEAIDFSKVIKQGTTQARILRAFGETKRTILGRATPDWLMLSIKSMFKLKPSIKDLNKKLMDNVKSNSIKKKNN